MLYLIEHVPHGAATIRLAVCCISSPPSPLFPVDLYCPIKLKFPKKIILKKFKTITCLWHWNGLESHLFPGCEEGQEVVPFKSATSHRSSNAKPEWWQERDLHFTIIFLIHTRAVCTGPVRHAENRSNPLTDSHTLVMSSSDNVSFFSSKVTLVKVYVRPNSFTVCFASPQQWSV